MKAARNMGPPPLHLHADWDGASAPEQPALVLVHGFTGSGASWNAVRDGLREFGPTLAVDLVGHGASPAPEAVAPYSMPACLDQLEALLKRLGIARAWWVGYSMGGRVVLQMAAHKPALVGGLVLESATAGLREPGQREERVRADEALAASILSDGLEAFTERWLANPLFKNLAKLPPAKFAEQREQRMRCNPLGLANSLRGMGSGAMDSVWRQLGEMDVPALVMAGEEDQKFTAIAQKLSAGLPRATLSLLPECGHTPHVENPGAYLGAMAQFFRECK